MVTTEITFAADGIETVIKTSGNGSLDAVSNALKDYTGVHYTLQEYTEHSMQEKGSGSIAAAYIGIQDAHGRMSWGVGTNTDIIRAGVDALLAAFNNMK